MVTTAALARSAAALAAASPTPSKRLVLIRHGQAAHNPRAEAARAAGCSFERFFELMREDDAFDAPLTEKGRDQARRAGARVGRGLRDAELLVASPLSRALETADLVLPPPGAGGAGVGGRPRRLALEGLREINGALANARRRETADLRRRFGPAWDFDLLPDADETWTEELEPQEECAERGYQSLLWLAQRPERFIVVVAHGGLLQFVLRDHPDVSVLDGRSAGDGDGHLPRRSVDARFGNCEAREFRLVITREDNNKSRATVNLEEVDMDVD